ncbi:VPLPA-CTERM sorting domain-containing protein [Rhodovulum marinum]|uniref:Putative secreted protein n=1 Tax=Rhodovulum marinum TaxID=320662 RepID=A0A4V2SQZ4_9RHOB|nr:VPLPA-CTERM sorting domain-containing protein [Rhodovulum marinum]TCP40836.1 putative secreted protein [Rhodovulum marinum]
MGNFTCFERFAVTAAATSLLALVGAFGASAETIVYNGLAGTSVANGYADFDLNGDGFDDIGFYAFDYVSGTQEGGVGTYSYELGGKLYRTSIVNESDATIGATLAVGFNPGDAIDATSGDFGGGGELYVNGSGTPYGILAAAGSSAYLGFQIEVGSNFGTNDGYYFFGAAQETYYGWIAVERGSVILGDYGLQNVSGEAAAIPTVGSGPSPVPLPAGLPLLLAGLGALGLVRRRR